MGKKKNEGLANLSSMTSELIKDSKDSFSNENKSFYIDEGEYIRRNVSPDKLVSNPDNVFNMRRDEEYLALETSIKEFGITNDIVVSPREGGKYLILSGHRRTQIAKELGLKTVPVKIRKTFENKYEELLFLCSENISTRAKAPLDMALMIEKIMKVVPKNIAGRKRDFIASAIGISARSVERYGNLLSLPDEARRWVDEGYLQLGEGAALGRLLKNSEETSLKFSELLNSTYRNDLDNARKKDMPKLVKQIIKSISKENNEDEEKKGSGRKIKIKYTLRAFNKKLSGEEKIDLPKQRKNIEETLKEVEYSIDKLTTLKKDLENKLS